MPDNATDKARKQKTPMHLNETRDKKSKAEPRRGSDAKDGDELDPRDSEGIDKA